MFEIEVLSNNLISKMGKVAEFVFTFSIKFRLTDG